MTIDLITLEVVKGLATLTLKTLWEMGNKRIDEPLKQIFLNASRQYVQNYAERHGTLKTACVRMDAPMRLKDLYTDVQVLKRSEIRYFETTDALQNQFRQSGRGFEYDRATRQAGITAANQFPRLLVLGSPGIGKSTFLRKVGLEALDRKNRQFQHECIPVFLDLKLFDSGQTQIEQMIAAEFRVCGFPDAEAFAKGALEKGKLLVLLDGLDEVPTEHLDRAMIQIQNLVDRYQTNRFIASCRIAAYKGGFQRFTDIAMAAFNDTQIEKFIRNWFRKEPQTADHCWELLKQPEYAAAKELGQTPLLLTLLCAVYDESQTFPKKRAALYGEALDVLLKKWAAEKRIHRNSIYKELSVELEQILLSEIAYSSFAADQLFFSKREITHQIRSFLVNNLNAPKHLDAEAVLTAIEVQQGILVERARDAYSFSHLTFQEYLTAQYTVDERQVEALVAEHLTDDRWREVFLLVAGLSRTADDLLELMEHEAHKLLNIDKLKALLSWADTITQNSAGNYQPAAKRSVAVFVSLALNYTRALNLFRALLLDLDLDLSLAILRYLSRDRPLDRDHPLDRDLDLSRNLSLDLFRYLDCDRTLDGTEIFNSVNFVALSAQLEALQAQTPDDNEPIEIRRRFDARLRQTWCDALQLNSDWLNLSVEEVRCLGNYLYANQLILQCKEAAVRVSPKTWEGIEARMLTVRE